MTMEFDLEAAIADDLARQTDAWLREQAASAGLTAERMAELFELERTFDTNMPAPGDFVFRPKLTLRLKLRTLVGI